MIYHAIVMVRPFKQRYFGTGHDIGRRDQGDMAEFASDLADQLVAVMDVLGDREAAGGGADVFVAEQDENPNVTGGGPQDSAQVGADVGVGGGAGVDEGFG